MNEQKSEVAQLLDQISLEYEAAARGLMGLSVGSTRHAFITARLEHIGVYHEQLAMWWLLRTSVRKVDDFALDFCIFSELCLHR